VSSTNVIDADDQLLAELDECSHQLDPT